MTDLRDVMREAAPGGTGDTENEAPARRSGRRKGKRAAEIETPPAPAPTEKWMVICWMRGKLSVQGAAGGPRTLLSFGDGEIISAQTMLACKRMPCASQLEFRPMSELTGEIERLAGLRGDALAAALPGCNDRFLLQRAYGAAGDGGMGAHDLGQMELRLRELDDKRGQDRQDSEFTMALSHANPSVLLPLLDGTENETTLARWLSIARALPGPGGQMRSALVALRLATLQDAKAAAASALQDAQEALIAARENARGADAE